MLDEAARIALFGSDEPLAPPQAVKVGNLTCLVDQEAIRAICWNGVEVIRAINWPVRDENWITLPPTVHSASLQATEEEATHQVTFSVGDGALECELAATFSADGTVRADLSMTATRDFDTNRAGFTVLHPIEGVAGEPHEILHSDGIRESSRFPRYVSPGQPAMDIAGLRHAVAGVAVDIAFEGEIFEMEDQRNWSDASYKTYCRPLVFPFTYRIGRGDTIRQSVRLSVEGGDTDAGTSTDNHVALTPGGALPETALAVEEGWLPDAEHHELLVGTGVRRLQVRTGPGHDLTYLEQVNHLAGALQAEMDLEVVVPEGAAPAAFFQQFSEHLAAVGIAPAHVLTVPEPYLKSHQPSGPWPEGPTPADCTEAARTVFASVRVGGGMLTNFTEFNRCPPVPGDCDFVSHGTTAIVHAADDRSVCETIEALSHVYDSAIHGGGGKPYRLGLASIGMRSNPYGADVADNPTQVRQTMARHDPRQCGLFGAAFAVGVLHATQGRAVDCVALAAPVGPFGIVAQDQPVKRVYYDVNPQAVIHPVFHVVRLATRMAKRQRLTVSGLPGGLHAVAAGDGGDWTMMIANLSDQPRSVRLPDEANVRSLDVSAFAQAVADPDWLVNSRSHRTADIVLEPYCTAFASTAGAPV